MTLLEQIQKLMQERNYCILCTASLDATPHSVGVIYAASPQLELYIVTGIATKKVRNIQANSKVAVTIPIPFWWLPIAPQRSIQFQGKAEILPFTDQRAQEVFFSRNKMTRRMIESETVSEICFIKVRPSKKIFTYGIGVPPKDMMKPEKAVKTIPLPADF